MNWFTWLISLVKAPLWWLRDFVLSILGAFWSQVVWPILSEVGGWLITLLPAGVQTYLQQLPWNTWSSYIDAAAWFVPFYAIVAILLTALSMIGAIRLVRWLLGLIPTMNLG